MRTKIEEPNFCLYKTNTGKWCNVRVLEFGEICKFHKTVIRRKHTPKQSKGVKTIQEWLS